MSVLIYIENWEGKFKKSTFEAISYASAIATNNKTSLIAISIGNVHESELLALAKYGVDKILNVNSSNLKNFINQAYASIVAQAVIKFNSDIVILSNTFSGRGLAPRIAAKLNAGLADNVIGLPNQINNKFIVKKFVFSGKAIANLELASKIKVISLSLNSYNIIENEKVAVIEDFNPQLVGNDFLAVIKEIIRSTDKVSLPDAEIVVSGGRGLRGPENWKMLEELADVLGGALACSKPVSDAGWRPHNEHVGQTGISVSPNLYIAVGISGAIQHLAGVTSSKVIVVINRDPEAPFFKVADYGIVGDAFDVIPKFIQAVKNYKALA